MRVIVNTIKAGPVKAVAVTRRPDVLTLWIADGLDSRVARALACEQLTLEERDAVRAAFGRPSVADEPCPERAWTGYPDDYCPETIPEAARGIVVEALADSA